MAHSKRRAGLALAVTLLVVLAGIIGIVRREPPVASAAEDSITITGHWIPSSSETGGRFQHSPIFNTTAGTGYCADIGDWETPWVGATLSGWSPGGPHLDYAIAKGWRNDNQVTIHGQSGTWARELTAYTVWGICCGDVEEALDYVIGIGGWKASVRAFYNECMAYNGGDRSIDGCSLIYNRPAGGYQRIVVKGVLDGDLDLTKSSTDGGIMARNANYRLEGAAYTIYTDAACTQPVTVGDGVAVALYVGADGKSNTITLTAGTYWAKETTAPAGFLLDTQPHQFEVIAGGETHGTTQDAPAFGHIQVVKTNQATGGVVTRPGFVFNLYKKGDRNNVLSTATTNEQGVATFCKPGTATPLDLEFGEYEVKEMEAPKPFDLNENWLQVKVMQANQNSGTAALAVLEGNEVGDPFGHGVNDTVIVKCPDTQWGYIQVIKKNKETGEVVTEAGFVFDLYNADKSEKLATGTTDETGTILFDRKLHVPGTYVVKEVSVPKPWNVTTSEFTVTLEADGNNGDAKSGSQHGHEGPDGDNIKNVIDNVVADAPQYGRVTLTKTDIEDEQPQDGAQFKVILLDEKVEYTSQGEANRTPSCSDPVYPVAQTTKLTRGSSTFNEADGTVTVTNPVVFLTDANGGTTDTFTTNGGTLTTGWLPIDKSGTSHYALVEVQSSNGHLINGTQIPFTLTYDESKRDSQGTGATATQKEYPNEIMLYKTAKGTGVPVGDATLAFWERSNDVTVQPQAGRDAYVLRTPDSSIVPHAYYRIDGGEVDGSQIEEGFVVHLVQQGNPDIVIDLESGVVEHAPIGTYNVTLKRKSDDKTLVYTGPSTIETKDGSSVSVKVTTGGFSGKNILEATVGEIQDREAQLSWDSANNAWIANNLRAHSEYQIEIGGKVVKVVKTSKDGGKVWFGRYSETDSQWFANHYIDQAALPKNDSQIITSKTLSGKAYGYETRTDAEGRIHWKRLPFGSYTLVEVKPAVDLNAHKSWLVDTIAHHFTVNSVTGYIKDDDKEGDTFEKSKSFSFEDDITRTRISKKEIVDGPEVEGAELVLTAKDNTEVDRWTSTKEPHYIENLMPGEYTLTEYLNPKDYDKASSVTFNLLPTGDITHVEMFDTPISIDAKIDKRQEIARPLDERYEANHEENNAAEQTNETGLYSYSLDFKSTSNTWTDEFTVEDPMEPANDGYARLITLVTPQAFQDYDGLMNVWYKTNKTPADYVEKPVTTDSTTKADSKDKDKTETETGTNSGTGTSSNANTGTSTGTGTGTDSGTGTGTETGDDSETETEVEPPSPMSQVPSMEAKDGSEVTVAEADEAVLSNVTVSIAGVSVGKLQPKVGSYKVSFLTVAELLRSGAPTLTGFKAEAETETDSEAGSDETGTGSETGTGTGTSTSTEDEWTWTVAGSLNEEATAKTYTLTVKHGASTYTYTFDYVVPEGIEGNPRSLLKGVYNATLSDGHVNPWLDEKDAMVADEDGDKRVISYKGWKIWEEGVDTAVAKRLDVADLKLADDEYITGIRFEYGRVEVGFTTRPNEWDRELLKDLHDDLDHIAAASGDSFDDPNESVKASVSRLEQVAKRFTTDASRELEEQAAQARKKAVRDYAQKLIDVETYNSRLAEYAEGTLPKFADALTLPAYDGDAGSIDELHATMDATKTSLSAAFMLGNTPLGRVAIYEAAENVWRTDANNGYISEATETELENALVAYSVAMDKVPVPEGAADMDAASQRLLEVLYKAIDEIALTGLSGRVPYAPAVLQMRLTDKYVTGVTMRNSAKVDAYRNGGNSKDANEGKLEGHDRDEVEQRPRDKDIQIGTQLATTDGKKTITSDGTQVITLVDTVSYHNLVPGHEYVMRGSLRKRNVAKDGTVTDGGPIGGSAGETKFKATEKDGTVTVKLTIPVGKDNVIPVVAFEELYPVIPDTGTTANYTLAEHKDINDANQTVRVTGPASDIVKTGDAVAPMVLLALTMAGMAFVATARSKQRRAA